MSRREAMRATVASSHWQFMVLAPVVMDCLTKSLHSSVWFQLKASPVKLRFAKPSKDDRASAGITGCPCPTLNGRALLMRIRALLSGPGILLLVCVQEGFNAFVRCNRPYVL
ncbi:hypothetical protein CEXT_509701 [Caerostris extrusa]|uniref:Secreted protein n=1 Tax=Caerostris extrusa TaxID=172846 RepID=A0AAV4U5K4_CAEEX|nr:hypothetical protein CEXT_509701 [Caerostris extrusa]